MNPATAGAELTVVVPAHNRAATLPRTLASIEAQTLRPFRVVLVDNESADTTLAIMQAWQKQMAGSIDVAIVSESRRGATHARNRGLQEVTTPWTCFFDSDDEMLPTHLADLMACAHANPEAAIVGRPIEQRLLSGRSTIGRFTTRNPLSTHLFHSIMATIRYIARTELFRSVGGWNTRVWGWDDMELGLRLLLTGAPMARAEGSPTVVAHSQADSITGTGFSSSPAKWEDTLDECSRHIASSALGEAPKRALQRVLDVRRLILSAFYAREGSRGEARRLRRTTMGRNPWHVRLRYALLWGWQRTAGHGTAQLTALLFPSTRL